MDRGSSASATTKHAEAEAEDILDDRRKERAGARDLDDTVESTPGLTRAAKDRQRAFPRDTTADIDHERKRRKLPAAGATRTPMSARQRDARSAAKNHTQDSMSGREYRALSDLMDVTSPTWVDLNNRLSDVQGDRQHLNETDQKHLGRVDRTIQRYEQDNDRGHVVYVNVRATPGVNSSNIAGYAANHFKPGTLVEFDRYTGAAHTMHEIEPSPSVAGRTVVFEIQTRRGMYLGQSRRVDNTSHLLPRAMRMKAVGSHTATYQRPDGTTDQRVVVQLVDDLDDSLTTKE